MNFRFQKLSFTEHCQWLSTQDINQIDVKQRKVESNQSRRSSSIEYFLPLRDGKTTLVCKSMFLSTLGLRSDGMITDLVRAQIRSYASAIAPIEDCRGKHPASHKYDTDTICLHINSYHESISHCKRKDTPNKRYLNPKI